MDIPMELTCQNMNDLSKIECKLTKEQFDIVAFNLHKLSLAKNIKLMDGTLSVWDMLVAEDIKNNKFELEDFIYAINQGIRIPMYNRIDYADIYQEANKNYLNKIIKYKNNELLEKENNRPQGISMPKEIREQLQEILKK